MTTPAIAFARFFSALLLGAVLGVYYGFLRPLRPRYTALSDLLFLPAAFWAWLYLSFGVCQGDLRLGYTAGLFLGAAVWELTAGRLLRPVFRGFWRFMGSCRRFLAAPFKNFFVFCKKI